MMFDYKKIRLLERMREAGASEANIGMVLTMFKKNKKNLNLVSKSQSIGSSINCSKMSIFEELHEFSRILSIKNLDLESIINISGSMYLI